MARNKRPKRHHFVPEMYLARFADRERHIVRVARASGEARTLSVKDAAVRTDYYTFTDEDGNPSPMVEQFLGLFETSAGAVFRDIDRGVFPPTGDLRARFAAFVALMFSRTPEIRDLLAEGVDFHYKSLLQAMPRDEIRRQLRKRHDREPTEEEVERIMAGLRRGDLVRFDVPKNAAVTAPLVYALEHLGRMVYGMQWQLVTTDAPTFLTSDHPVVFWREPSEGIRPPGVGLLTADEVYFPVGPRQLLVLTQAGSTRPAFRETPEAVVRVNTGLVEASYEWIFHHPAHDPLAGITIPDDRPLLTVNGAPIYRGGCGNDEALGRVRDNVLHQPGRSASFAVTIPGYAREKQREGWHGNPAVHDGWMFHQRTFGASPLRQPGDRLFMALDVTKDRAVYVFARGRKYWAIAHDVREDTWEDLGEQSAEDMRRLRE